MGRPGQTADVEGRSRRSWTRRLISRHTLAGQGNVDGDRQTFDTKSDQVKLRANRTGPMVGIEPRLGTLRRRVSVPFGVAPLMSFSNLALRLFVDMTVEGKNADRSRDPPIQRSTDRVVILGSCFGFIRALASIVTRHLARSAQSIWPGSLGGRVGDTTRHKLAQSNFRI